MPHSQAWLPNCVICVPSYYRHCPLSAAAGEGPNLSQAVFVFTVIKCLWQSSKCSGSQRPDQQQEDAVR